MVTFLNIVLICVDNPFKVRFRIYSISSTYEVILEWIALTMLELQLGERALVSGSRFSKMRLNPFSVYTFAHSIEETPFHG